MTELSKSPNSYNHWIGKTYTDDDGNEIDLYKVFSDERSEREKDDQWKKNNLEYDLRTSDLIINKVRSSREYAKQLYATLCNNEFIKRDMWEILKDNTWGCSWRHAGGIIADIDGKGDYMDWYCGGNEGHIFENIKEDLYSLGWIIVNQEKNG